MRHSKRYLLAITAYLFTLTSFFLLMSSRITDYNVDEIIEVSNEYVSHDTQESKSIYHLSERLPFNLHCHRKLDKNPSQSTSLKTSKQDRSRNIKDNFVDASRERHILDYVNFPTRVVSYDFSKCRMSNCFDFSRCQAAGPMKVHIVPSWKDGLEEVNITLGESDIIHKTIMKTIKESEYFEPDPKRACIFVLEDDTLDRDPLSQGFQSDLSNIFGKSNFYGMNHLVFNLYSGSWPEYKENDFASLQIGAAILAKASNSILYHRQDFDISLPLFSYLHPSSNDPFERERDTMDKAMDDNRTYLLTFKGKRYVFGSGSDTRNSLYHLNNQRDVIMLTTCRHGKKWRESVDSRCSEDEASYDQYDFVDLMKESKFCLIPRGRRLGSFRFLEALSYGCIPVILSDGWVKPFDEIIDWSCATVQFDESTLLLVPDMLRDFGQDIIRKMRRNCRALYNRYFSTTKKIILTTLSLIEQRIKGHLNSSQIKKDH